MPYPSRGGLDGFPLERCRELRRKQTRAEEQLWRALRNRALGGLKFRRQHPFGPFILDFYCREAELAIELDGLSHVGGAARTADAGRTAFLERRGVEVIRFENEQVLGELDAVLGVIGVRARARSAAPPVDAGGCERTGHASPSP